MNDETMKAFDEVKDKMLKEMRNCAFCDYVTPHSADELVMHISEKHKALANPEYLKMIKDSILAKGNAI